MYKLIFLMLILISCNGIKTDKVNVVNKVQNIDSYVFIEKYDNGKIKIKGSLVKEIRQGKWESFYENGVKWSELNYLNGKQNGISKSFYNNSNLRFYGSYRDGIKVGVWFFYLENGKFEKEIDFDLINSKNGK